MTSRTSEETRLLLLTLLAAELQDEPLYSPFAVRRVRYLSANDLQQRRGRLEFVALLNRKIELSFRHVWDDQPLTRAEIDKEVEEIIGFVRAIDAAATEITEDLRDAAAEARKEARRCARLGMQVTFDSVSLEQLDTHNSRLPDVVVTFSKLNDGLAPVLSSVEIGHPHELRNWFGDENGEQALLSRRYKEVTAAGADGIIDMTLFSALAQNGIDVFDEIARDMKFAEECAVTDAHGPIRTGFAGGVFTGIFNIGPHARYAYNELRFDLPGSSKGAIPSRHVCDLIDHPYLPDDLTFYSDEISANSKLYHAVKPVLSYFSLAERRIWGRAE